jgi:predicted nuclease of predicted toxin-antitoxin system
VKLKLDENLGIRHREQLRRAGHDVDTVHEEQLSGASDPAVLDAAVAADRALVTLDVDFANPFRFPPELTAGIAVLRVREGPGGRDIDRVIEHLIRGLARQPLEARLWIVREDRIRQYEPSPKGPSANEP